MIVIADTTPLNYFVQLGFPDVLREIYGRVLVPATVLTEMQHVDAPPEVRAWAADPPAWLERVVVRRLDSTPAETLGAGEREAISLALELGADILLIDESAGRREASSRQITVTGTLAVLLQASLRGYCSFPEAVKQVRDLGFWVSAATEGVMMARYREAKQRGS